MYLIPILWYASWPLLVYFTYRVIWFLINHYEKTGMFRIQPVEETINE